MLLAVDLDDLVSAGLSTFFESKFELFRTRQLDSIKKPEPDATGVHNSWPSFTMQLAIYVPLLSAAEAFDSWAIFTMQIAIDIPCLS